MTALSETPEIRDFAEKLTREKDDHQSVKDLFLQYLKQKSFDRFVEQELAAIASDPGHIVQNSVGQVNFTAINTADFDLTIRLALPFNHRPHQIKWFGHRQFLAALGSSSATVRILRVPENTDINDFRRNVELTRVREIQVGNGDLVSDADMFDILDVVDIRSAIVFHSLTLKNQSADLHWTFDRNLRSIFAESARMTTSRIQTIMEAAIAMGIAIPPHLYEAVFRSDDSYLRLFAIRQMLRTGNADGFSRLHEALESDKPLLRTGARAIFDALTASTAQTRENKPW